MGFVFRILLASSMATMALSASSSAGGVAAVRRMPRSQEALEPEHGDDAKMVTLEVFPDASLHEVEAMPEDKSATTSTPSSGPSTPEAAEATTTANEEDSEQPLIDEIVRDAQQLEQIHNTTNTTTMTSTRTTHAPGGKGRGGQ
mmetsp:Transcript_39993/g.92093  ORF Transcript_39993/g.92093 Transcript_39993/m.92093 type:complete len:144 (-) Transcript_39993:139-570(-)